MGEVGECGGQFGCGFWEGEGILIVDVGGLDVVSEVWLWWLNEYGVRFGGGGKGDWKDNWGAGMYALNSLEDP